MYFLNLYFFVHFQEMSHYSTRNAVIILSSMFTFFSYLHHQQFLYSSTPDSSILAFLLISWAQCFPKCSIRTRGLFAAPHGTVIYHLEEMCVKFNSQSRRQTSPAERKENVQTLESGRQSTVLTRTTRVRQISEVLYTWNGIFFVTLKRKTANLWLLTLQQQAKGKFTITQLHQDKYLHPKDCSNLG